MKTNTTTLKKLLAKAIPAVLGLFVGLQTNLNAQTQNNVWSLPSNYLKNSAPLPLPNGPLLGQDYKGEQALHVHNAMQDANGNLLFFVMDGKVFDKDGYLIDEMYHSSFGTIPGGQEICIVPDPGNCQRYYIFSSTQGNFPRPFYSVLDLDLPNIWTPGRMGGLVYGGSGSAVNMTSLLPPQDWFRGRIGYAASKLRPDNSRFVFLHNGIDQIYRLKITSSGLLYDSYVINCGGEESSEQRAEVELVELSNGHYRLATTSTQTTSIVPPSSHHVFYTELDANGNVIPGTSQFYYFYASGGNEAHVYGLEFSADGNYLYMTHKATPKHANPIEYIDVSTNVAYPLTVTGQQDFQFTQIELGRDGKLYFSTNNRLATLSNPNSPSPANWVNSAVPISYYQTLDFAGPSSDSSYTLPDQIDGMDYTTHFFANTQCCLSGIFFNAEIFTASVDATWMPGTSSNPFGSTSGEVFIEKELIISAGKIITIQNMTFKFAPGAKVVIERGTGQLAGGKLILNNTTFTVDDRCDSNAMWLGVQVYGHSNQNQTPYSTSQQGWFIMKNGSVIEHALKGAVAVKINSNPSYPYNFISYDFNFTGGVIQATNSYFKNNRQDVEFRKYMAPGGTNNQSRFTNCEFATNGPLRNPIYYPVYHVLMHEVVGIGFYGNDFKNLTPNLYNYWQQGWGIYSVDAHYFVNARCLSMTFPCSSFDPNVFQDLYFGIRAFSSNALRTLKADRNKFINNFFGVYIGGPDFATFTRNNFEVYRSAAPNQTFATYGIYLNGCHGYKVEENTFTEYNDISVPAGGNTYGVIVNNSGTLHNEIYKNQFYDIKIGGQAQGINGENFAYSDPNPSNEGLQFRCNTFYNDVFQADLAVTSGRIDYHQGYSLPHTDPMTVVSPAGNKFSHSTFDPQNDIAANNVVLAFNYSHHADLITTPLYYNFSVVTPQQCASIANPVYFSNTQSCPTKIKDGGIIVLSPALKAQTDSLKQVIANKENLIDGGNTNNLLNIIATLSSGDVKNILIAASPYLSDEVLLAYLATNPPAGHIRQVILANSPVSSEVLNALNGMSIPNGIKNQINNAQTGVSAMTYLNNEIGFAKSERSGLIDERIRLFLNDTLVQNPLDSVAVILKDENIEIRKKQLCDAYIGKGETLKALETRDELAIEHGYDNYIKMADVQLGMYNMPSSCFAIITDPGIKQEVESVAYDPNDRINAVRGEALLAVAFDSLFLALVEPLEPIGSGLRMGETGNNGIQQAEKQSMLNIYPNPSDGGSQVVLELQTTDNELMENASIEVYSVTGQLVATHQFNGTGNQVFIQPGKIMPGVYLVKLYNNGQLAETKKLIIKY
ncbi:MAG: T9SS type A sorting domain-containing protein [Candidatus Kapabacteria bacterium]|nr:T9SS type A sorting domain-containing protein [Candidatus Kapabacteria bacterium]